MKWNAFDLITPAIDKTKELLFPIKISNWFKLGFISLLAAGSGGGSSIFQGGTGGNNFSIPASNEKTATITGNAISNTAAGLGGLLGAFIIILVLIKLVLTWITSVFAFIFIDSLISKQYNISNSWKNNTGKGGRLLGFRIIVGIVTLVVMGLIFLPLIIDVINAKGIMNYMETISLGSFLIKFFIGIMLFFLYVFILSIFLTFVYDFSIVDMYNNNIPMKKALGNTFRNIRAQKMESLVYLFAKLLIGLLVGLISIIVLLIFLIPFGLISLIIFIPLFLVSKVIAIVVLIPWILLLIYLFQVVSLPLPVFLKYFSLLGYEKMYKKKILK